MCHLLVPDPSWKFTKTNRKWDMYMDMWVLHNGRSSLPTRTGTFLHCVFCCGHQHGALSPQIYPNIWRVPRNCWKHRYFHWPRSLDKKTKNGTMDSPQRRRFGSDGFSQAGRLPPLAGDRTGTVWSEFSSWDSLEGVGMQQTWFF